jgi:hypothetical protein
MVRQTLTALLAVALSACASQLEDRRGSRGTTAGGEEGAEATESACPVPSYDADKIGEALDKAQTCYDAANIAERCAFGSSIDVGFVAQATEVCTQGFGKMSAEDTAAYKRLLDACAKKFEDSEGTLYRSMAAFCMLEVTKTFVEFYPETEEGLEVTVTTSPKPCPAAIESDPDAIEKAIGEAQYCYKATEIAESCAYGSSIDGAFVGAATEVCEQSFSGKLSAKDKALYDSLLGRCGAKYENESGTLYRSMTAFCGLQVTEMFESIYSEVEN